MNSLLSHQKSELIDLIRLHRSQSGYVYVYFSSAYYATLVYSPGHKIVLTVLYDAYFIPLATQRTSSSIMLALKFYNLTGIAVQSRRLNGDIVQQQLQ